MVLKNVSMHLHHLESLLRHRFLGTTPRSSDSVSVEWVLRIYSSMKFPGDDDVAGSGVTFRKPLLIGVSGL